MQAPIRCLPTSHKLRGTYWIEHLQYKLVFITSHFQYDQAAIKKPKKPRSEALRPRQCNGKYTTPTAHVMHMIKLTVHVRVNRSYSVCTYLLHLIPKPRSRDLCNQLRMSLSVPCTGMFQNSASLLITFVKQLITHKYFYLCIDRRLHIGNLWGTLNQQHLTTNSSSITADSIHSTLSQIPRETYRLSDDLTSSMKIKANYISSVHWVSFRWFNSSKLLTDNFVQLLNDYLKFLAVSPGDP